MKFFGQLLIFLFCSLTVSGQKNLTLTGTLIDATNEPIFSGSVDLLMAKDSSYVNGTTSDARGIFSFKNLEAADYILKISYLGYLPITKNVSLNGTRTTTTNLDKIILKTNDILLKETIIEGKKPEIIVKNDTIEYDAASYKVPQNAVVEDLIKKLPGAEVDKDGKVTVNGKEIKGFTLNGKEYFTDDPQITTKNLPADMVEKLQVFDRKSEQARLTGFDDGEEQTFINLTIRQGMMKGTVGNVQVGLGEDVEKDNDVRYNANAFLNHMKDDNRYTLMVRTNNTNNMGGSDMMGIRGGGGGGFGGAGITEVQNYMLGINSQLSPQLSLNGDVRYNGQERYSGSNSDKATLSQNQSQLDRTLSDINSYSNYVSSNFRLDWNPNKQHTLTFRPNLRFNRTHNDRNELTDRLDYDKFINNPNAYDESVIFKANTVTNNKGKSINLGGNLDYAYKFASKEGRVLSLNARGNYSNNNSQGKTLYSQENYTDGIYTSDENRNQRSENDNNSNSYRASLSFVEPVGHNNFLQLMYRISYSDSKAINSTYDIRDEQIAEYLYSALLMDTAIIRTTQSRSTLRNATEQRIGLNFKAVRSKYNVTIGFNVDPTHSLNETYQPSLNLVGNQIIPRDFDGHLKNIMGDSLISSIPLDVVNFSPVLTFNYLPSQGTNLRINYEGETNQPSADQLKGYVDESNPTDMTQGNPNLKPGYSNSLRIQFRKFNSNTQFMYSFMFNGGFSVNDITAVTKLLDKGNRLTTYENVNGNRNGRLMGMFNTPLKNKKFTIGNMLMASLQRTNSYVDDLKNTGNSRMLMDNLNINYRSDLFDIGTNLSISNNHTSYTVNTGMNQNTFNYGIGGYTQWYLPKDWTIDSDINWTKRDGYYGGFNISQTLWNAGVTKQLFNKKYGTGALKLQIFDILQNRSSIGFYQSTNGFTTQQVTVIPSYFLASFVYKFSLFPSDSSATEKDMFPGGDRSRGRFPGGGDGGGGRRGGSGGGGRF
jgi:hypothetical protein